MASIIVTVAIVGLVVFLLFGFFVSRIRTPKAGEILVVTGGHGGPEMHAKQVFVMPFVRKVQSLQVGVQKTEISLPETMTLQGVPLKVDAVVAFKIDTAPAVVGNAIERFSEQPETMTDFVHTVFAGHLRAIIGGMTAEEVTIGRDALARNVREASSQEMSNLGLKIDSVQIKDVEDASGGQFLQAWRQREQAKMVAEARIAEAEADRAATEKEQEAEARKAEARATSEIRQAEVKAQSDRARAESEQAGPLAAAIAKQKVIEASTRNTQLEAALREQTLQVEVIKPAEAERDAAVRRADGAAQALVLTAKAEREKTQLDAEAAKVKVELAAQADAARVKVNGDATAEATRAVGQAEADATEAKGLAEAKAIEARAEALKANSDAVLQQMIAEQMPEIVRAASEPIAGVRNLTLVDVKSLQEMPGGNVAAAVAMLPMLVNGLKGLAAPNGTDGGTNGDVPSGDDGGKPARRGAAK
jgi:flotillin